MKNKIVGLPATCSTLPAVWAVSARRERWPNGRAFSGASMPFSLTHVRSPLSCALQACHHQEYGQPDP